MTQPRMKIISGNEAHGIEFAPPGRGHMVRRHMRLLKVDEVLSVPRLAWDWKRKTPYAIVKPENDKGDREYEFYDKPDYSGWYIKRVR